MNNLRDIRIKNNLKQKDMAEILNITTSYYGMIEIGKRKPSLVMALKISKYFNIPIDEIFKIDDDGNI